MSATEFFNKLYGGIDEGYITVWHKRTKRTKWFYIKDKDAAVKYVLSKATDEKYPDEIYYGVCLRKERREETVRGEFADISVMPCLWWDIDVAENDNVHVQKDLPNSFEEAIDFVKNISPPPSVIVHSGHGLHAYWLFEKPLLISNEAERKRCQTLSSDWQTYLNNEGAKRGWKGDNTSDLPRILRLPQTFNRKNGGHIEVKVIENIEARYLPDEFIKTPEQRVDKSAAANTMITENNSMDFSDIVTGGTERLAGCKFLQYCKQHATSLTEPEWYACISNLALCKDGAKHCHSISKSHPKYNYKETQNKIAHAQKAKKPISCAYIRNALGYDCGDCSLCVKAPVALTVISKAEKVKETLAQFPKDIKGAFASEFLAALSYAKQNMVAEYSLLKGELKKQLGVNLNDLERAVKAVKQTAQQSTIPQEVKRLTFDGLDAEFVLPKGYEVTAERGVEKQTTNGITPVCFQPIVITKRIHYIDKTSERVKLKFLCRGRWETITENKSVLSNRNSIVRLADYGLAVTSNNAGVIIQYLTDFESANNTIIPTSDVVSKIGWRDFDFLPFTSNSIFFEADDSAGSDLAAGLTEHGSFKQWLTAAETVRKASAASRFLFSASFASPLMKLIDARTFMVFVWCESGYGKSGSKCPKRLVGN